MIKDFLLSENFSLKEFIYSKISGTTVQMLPIQYILLKKLVYNIMQPIRTWYGNPIYITSGIRNKIIMNALREKGYPVSLRTDHAYADPEINPFGTGACDFTVSNPKDLVSIYSWVKNTINISLIGQMIIYIKNKGQVGNFIHISNSIDVFCSAIKELQKKERFLMRRNGHYSIPDFSILTKEVK